MRPGPAATLVNPPLFDFDPLLRIFTLFPFGLKEFHIHRQDGINHVRAVPTLDLREVADLPGERPAPSPQFASFP